MDFGGPLGLYRGGECDNPRPLTDPFACPAADESLPDAVIFGGSFYPYPAVGDELSALGLPNPCDRYQSHADYLSDVATAAQYAVDQQWILAEDVDVIVADAEERAAEYPGCVPAA